MFSALGWIQRIRHSSTDIDYRDLFDQCDGKLKLMKAGRGELDSYPARFQYITLHRKTKVFLMGE